MLGLGPISVLPDYQRQGIGQALMHAVIGAADVAGEPLIALLGDPRFTVGSASWRRPGWESLLRTLSGARTFRCERSHTARRIAGTFRYAAPFE